jgi:TonB-dependent starch-binding outer membrane protein SusC
MFFKPIQSGQSLFALLFFALLLQPFSSFAQEKNTLIKGVVQNAQKTPLASVTVLLRNTKTDKTVGANTDSSGNFTFTHISPGGPYSLSFSMVGYQPHNLYGYNIKSGDALTLSVELKEATVALDQVVVVGYGTARKKDVTGSVAKVSSQELNSFPVNNPVQGMQGRVAGVQVSQNSGEPGGTVSVRIRGGNSLQGGNEPLYVVDGFALSGPPSAINPNDIESMDVLKDASATAIYGSRGANGVVLITTKAGKAGKTQVSLDSYYGIQQLTKRLELMNAKEFALLANERAANDNVQPFFTQAQIDSFGEGTDWQSVLFRKAAIQNHGLTVSGGSENTQFSVSANYFGQEGILQGSNFQRGSLRGNVNQKISSKLKLNYNTVLSNTIRAAINNNNGQKGSTVLSGVLVAPPTIPVYDSAGNFSNITPYSFSPNALDHPLANAIARKDKTNEIYVLAGMAFTYEPIKALQLKSSIGIEAANARRDVFSPAVLKVSPVGYAAIATIERRNILNENTVTYTRWFGEHNLNLLGGVTYQSEKLRTDSASSSGFATDLLTTNSLQSGTTPGVPNSASSKWVIGSYLARVNYAYKGKYLLTASFRADGSSRFGTNNKWGYFPSAAFAWRAIDEDFMKNINFLSDLKLRLSWGQTGNTALSPYQTLLTLSPNQAVLGNQIVVGFMPRVLANPNLKWESTASANIGLDIGVLKNRITLTADYYKKNTKDLLATVPLQTSTGFASTIMNIGEIENKGIELALNGNVVNTKLKWDVSVNFSKNRNKVLALAGGSDVFGAIVAQPLLVPVSLVRVGNPLGVFYGYIEDGLDGKGAIKYVDLNKDGILTSADRTIIGNPNPDFLYGFNSRLNYKNFDLNFFIQGSKGGDIFNVNPTSIANSIYFGENQLKEVFYNHWSPSNPNPSAKYPKISQTTTFKESNRFVEDGSYLRLKNVQLAYNLPVSKMGVNWFKRMQVYVSAQNLWTKTKYTGYDPEISTFGGSNSFSVGIDQTGYPTAKTFTFGLHAGF